MEVNRSHRSWVFWSVVLTVLVAAAAILGWYIYHDRHHDGAAGPPQPPAKTTSQFAGSTKPLTAGGVAVPATWQAKARRLGYYCPSWAATPGQAASGVCLPLDK